MKEADVQKAIIDFIRYKGGWVVKVPAGAAMRFRGDQKYFVRLAEAGTPDLVACYKGQFIAIEVKRDTTAVGAWHRGVDERSICQHIQKGLIEDTGGKFVIACCIEDVEELFN